MKKKTKKSASKKISSFSKQDVRDILKYAGEGGYHLRFQFLERLGLFQFLERLGLSDYSFAKKSAMDDKNARKLGAILAQVNENNGWAGVYQGDLSLSLLIHIVKDGVENLKKKIAVASVIHDWSSLVKNQGGVPVFLSNSDNPKRNEVAIASEVELASLSKENLSHLFSSAEVFSEFLKAQENDYLHSTGNFESFPPSKVPVDMNEASSTLKDCATKAAFFSACADMERSDDRSNISFWSILDNEKFHSNFYHWCAEKINTSVEPEKTMERLKEFNISTFFANNGGFGSYRNFCESFDRAFDDPSSFEENAKISEPEIIFENDGFENGGFLDRVRSLGLLSDDIVEEVRGGKVAIPEGVSPELEEMSSKILMKAKRKRDEDAESIDNDSRRRNDTPGCR